MFHEVNLASDSLSAHQTAIFMNPKLDCMVWIPNIELMYTIIHHKITLLFLSHSYASYQICRTLYKDDYNILELAPYRKTHAHIMHQIVVATSIL